MFGLVRRTRLEKAEAETSMVLAQFAEAVATATRAVEQGQATLASLKSSIETSRTWAGLYEAQAAELKKAQDARDLAHWVIRVPGTENIGPPTCIGEYIEGGH